MSQGYGRVHVGAASRDLERAEDQPVVGNKKFQSTGLAGWETIIAMERSTIFNGKIHYFDWVIFNSYVTRGYISHIVASSFRVTNIDDGRSLYRLTF